LRENTQIILSVVPEGNVVQAPPPQAFPHAQPVLGLEKAKIALKIVFKLKRFSHKLALALRETSPALNLRLRARREYLEIW